jgi:hypothetical protein
MASDFEPLDLVDIAVLLLYEWATLEPRFRHTKLAEVAYPGQKVQYQPGLPFGDDTLSNRTWILLKRKEGSENERDLPTNMVDKDVGWIHFSTKYVHSTSVLQLWRSYRISSISFRLTPSFASGLVPWTISMVCRM